MTFCPSRTSYLVCIVSSLTAKPTGKQKVAHHSMKLLKWVVILSKKSLLEVLIDYVNMQIKYGLCVYRHQNIPVHVVVLSMPIYTCTFIFMGDSRCCRSYSQFLAECAYLLSVDFMNKVNLTRGNRIVVFRLRNTNQNITKFQYYQSQVSLLSFLHSPQWYITQWNKTTFVQYGGAT